MLECRLEQLRGALDEARAEADQARIRLAEALAREAGETHGLSVLQDEVARARAEVAALHRRHIHALAYLRPWITPGSAPDRAGLTVRTATGQTYLTTGTAGAVTGALRMRPRG